MLFNRPIRGLILRMNRSLINHDNDEENHDTLVKDEVSNKEHNDTFKESTLIHVWSTVAV